LLKLSAVILPAQVQRGIQAEESILTKYSKTRSTDLILVFCHRGCARNI